jgi:c-di-GMP-binding flagellar brake protein YcgR
MLKDSIRFIIKKIFFRQSDPFTDSLEPIISHSTTGAQQRRFVRMGCIFPITITPLSSQKTQQAVLINLSGNGGLFVCNQEYTPEEKITISGTIFGRLMSISAIVTREDKSLSSLKEMHGYGMEICSITKLDQEHIISSIFEQNNWLKELL